RPRLREVVRTWEAATDGRCPEGPELPSCIPPLGAVHLADPTDGNTKSKQVIEVDAISAYQHKRSLLPISVPHSTGRACCLGHHARRDPPPAPRHLGGHLHASRRSGTGTTSPPPRPRVCGRCLSSGMTRMRRTRPSCP